MDHKLLPWDAQPVSSEVRPLQDGRIREMRPGGMTVHEMAVAGFSVGVTKDCAFVIDRVVDAPPPMKKKKVDAENTAITLSAAALMDDCEAPDSLGGRVKGDVGRGWSG
eukprot:4533845-Pyramimonas_sp.AAC.1